MLCQVSEWIQRILAIGAAFAGADGAKSLRALLTAQAGNFFRSARLLHMARLHWRARSLLPSKTDMCSALHSLPMVKTILMVTATFYSSHS